MRESFVFHEDYICDLPADYKADFMRYTVEYGLYGQKPRIADGTLEMALWAKIARRIDAEAERYQAISEKRREAANKRYAKATPPAVKNINVAEGPEVATDKEEPAKHTSFEKPTVKEIAVYCSERKNGIDPQAFFDFYESKGWKVGAVKMKDWRASVRTWEQRRKTEQTGGRNKASGMWGNENEIPDEITDLF